MTRRTFSAICLSGALCLLGPLTGTARAAEEPPKAIVVPLTLLRTKHLVVPVRINGQGPFRLVFDTGSPITFISGRVARGVGLIDGAAAKAPTLMGMRGQKVAKTFEVGGATVKDFSIMVLDHPVIEVLSQVDGPVDGIVGHTFFARFATSIDYSRDELTLTPNGVQPQDAVMGLMARLNGPRTAPKPVSPSGLWGIALARKDGETGPGVTVTAVAPKSAADAAGLKPGDRILTLDGRWTDSVMEAYEAAAAATPGGEVAVVIQRGTEEKELKVKPRQGL